MKYIIAFIVFAALCVGFMTGCISPQYYKRQMHDERRKYLELIASDDQIIGALQRRLDTCSDSNTTKADQIKRLIKYKIIETPVQTIPAEAQDGE